MFESLCLYGGVAAYLAGTVTAQVGASTRKPLTVAVLAAVMMAVLMFATAIALRWNRLEHGPFLTLFEILLSNLFSLGLIYGLAYWRFPAVRPGAVVALPILAMLGLWILLLSPEPRPLPATYDNSWLWVHVLAGKLFLGSCLVSTGLAGALLIGAVPASANEDADAAAWQAFAVAFVFQSLMLVAGAAWAQDAWGRFWAWDPLETWSFLVWLAAGAALHQRLSFMVSRRLGWSFVVAVFALAVVTFLGIPFLSVAAHKGVM